MSTYPKILAPGVPILQNGYVVDNLERAMEQWLALGVGPFIRLDIDLEEAVYRGTPQPIRARFGLAQAGGIQIELIEPVGDHPCAYRDSVPVGESALHHVMKISQDYDADLAALRRAGFEVANEGVFGGGMRLAYVDTRSAIGCMLEIIADCEAIQMISAAVIAASIDWDGSDPVRQLAVEG